MYVLLYPAYAEHYTPRVASTTIVHACRTHGFDYKDAYARA